MANQERAARADGGESARQQVATFGEELEALVALARGPEQARQKARRRALALQCEMRALDGAVRSGSEQIVLQVRVSVHTSCSYVLACAAAAAQGRALAPACHELRFSISTRTRL